jgi:ankyrin repeat protein
VLSPALCSLLLQLCAGQTDPSRLLNLPGGHRMLSGGHEQTKPRFATLSEAVQHDDIRGLKLLLDEGQNPNAPTPDVSPLRLACTLKRMPALKLLIDAGAQPSDCTGWNAESRGVLDEGLKDLRLLTACEGPDAEAIGAALKAGARIEARRGDGLHCVEVAAQQGSVECLKAALKSGGKVSGDALALAIEANRDDAAELLVKAHAPLRPRSKDSEPLLQLAAKQRMVKTLTALREAGVKVNAVDKTGAEDAGSRP